MFESPSPIVAAMIIGLTLRCDGFINVFRRGLFAVEAGENLPNGIQEKQVRMWKKLPQRISERFVPMLFNR